MSISTRYLKEDITRWPVTGSNGYGGFTFGTPIKLKGRWEFMQELFRDDSGEEKVSNAVVFVDADVPIGDYLAQGDLTAEPDPTTIAADTFRVMQFRRHTDLRTLDNIRKAFL